MNLRYYVTVIINNKKELKMVLAALEKEGYRWRTGQKPTQWKIPEFVGKLYLNVHEERFITYDDDFVLFELISAKEFLGENNCIVVYRNGVETVALDKETGKRAVVKCHPDDEYDFYTGAKLAFERLTGDKKEQPKQLYNGKVVYVGVNDEIFDTGFTTGKIYEFVDGIVIDDDRIKRPIKGSRPPIATKEDGWFRKYFIEVVE